MKKSLSPLNGGQGKKPRRQENDISGGNGAGQQIVCARGRATVGVISGGGGVSRGTWGTVGSASAPKMQSTVLTALYSRVAGVPLSIHIPGYGQAWDTNTDTTKGNAEPRYRQKDLGGDLLCDHGCGGGSASQRLTSEGGEEV